MKDPERWRQLAEMAAVEPQDPDKLVELVREINELLDEKQRRLSQQRQEPASKKFA
jgi:hypothetical protein